MADFVCQNGRPIRTGRMPICANIAGIGAFQFLQTSVHGVADANLTSRQIAIRISAAAEIKGLDSAEKALQLGIAVKDLLIGFGYATRRFKVYAIQRNIAAGSEPVLIAQPAVQLRDAGQAINGPGSTTGSHPVTMSASSSHHITSFPARAQVQRGRKCASQYCQCSHPARRRRRGSFQASAG